MPANSKVDWHYYRKCCSLCVDDTKCEFYFNTPGGRCWCACHEEIFKFTGWTAIKDKENPRPAIEVPIKDVKKKKKKKKPKEEKDNPKDFHSGPDGWNI
jgi:hypothetical protein